MVPILLSVVGGSRLLVVVYWLLGCWLLVCCVLVRVLVLVVWRLVFGAWCLALGAQ